MELLPRPAVHPDLPRAAAFAVPNEHRSATRIEIGLGQVERLADPHPSAPEKHDQRAQANTVEPIAGGAQCRR